jgi:hypothetical protein
MKEKDAEGLPLSKTKESTRKDEKEIELNRIDPGLSPEQSRNEQRCGSTWVSKIRL